MIKLSRTAVASLGAWVSRYGLPRSYCAVDCETSGLHDTAKILHLGWVTVDDTRTVRSEGVVIDWTRTMTEPQIADLTRDMRTTKLRMEEKGNEYMWTIEEIQKRGVTPAEAVDRFLRSWNRKPLVAHNGWGFDYLKIGKLLESNDVPFELPHTDLMDTCLMARCVLAPAAPRANEPYREYVSRLSQTRCGRHSLRDCVGMFDLHQYGVDPRHGHDAEYDAWVCALLLERFREMAEACVTA